MSLIVMGKVWSIGFSPASKFLVAVHLASVSNDNGVSWWSNNQIARRCKLSVQTVKAIMAELQEEQWIGREAQFRVNGSQTSSVVRWNLEKLAREAKTADKEWLRQAREDRALETQEQREDEEHTPGVNLTPPQVQALPPGGVSDVPLPQVQNVPPLETSLKRNLNTIPPIVPRVNGSPSKEGKAGNQAKALVQAFAGVYRERFRGDYVPHPKRDTAAAVALASAGVTGEQVADRFRAATRVRGGFWCAKANCLPVLADHWNEIGAEIVGQGRNLEAGVEPGSSESDPSEWVRSMENLPDVTR